MEVGRITGVVLAVILCSANLSQAALPFEQYEKWVKDFQEDVEVEAVIVFRSVDMRFLERVKMMFGKSPVCAAHYIVKDILRQPDGMGLKVTDEIVLTYPCDSNFRMNWSGSLLPWARVKEDSLIEMAVRSSDIFQKDGYFVLDNDKNIFGPAFPGGLKGIGEKP
ncbi:MAG: hypothetical protein Q8Q08_04060 [Candidatus Omnitrophota bacterium]|nr:hypothetical protein [Candidatus Omnitrophota bacterium]